MEYKIDGDDCVLRLEPGEEIIACIDQVCARENLRAGYVASAVGALRAATVGLYDLGEKQFLAHTIDKPLELISLSGNISRMNEAVYTHFHAVVADKNAAVYGGHLSRAVVSATAEIVLRRIPLELGRRSDQETGLNLLTFPSTCV